MLKLLRADLYRMYRKKWLRLFALTMLVLSAALVSIQHTAMDYSVALDRVLFLPMAFFGMAAAAFVSLFIGDDFSGGFLKNKIISGASRNAVYFSSLIACLLGCVTVYLITLAITLGLGVNLFFNNVNLAGFAGYSLLGLLTCLAYGSIFCMIAMLTGNKSVSAVLCMALSFGMLFLSLHTHQALAQAPIKNGAPNPAFVGGIRRTVYALLHDINPTGQAAQLSTMQCLSKVRWVLVDLLWLAVTSLAGACAFQKKNLR